jgi:nonsense-mediated mRNA decay protein 3
MLQQTSVVEFQIVNQICDDCQRVEAKDYWKCVVQVRQRARHKKTFFYIEQLILKLNIHSKTVSIKQTPDGIDFYYAQVPDANKLVDFLMTVAPCRFEQSKRLISHDVHSNTYNNKHTFSVEIAPICKDDIVCLPQALARRLDINPICVCTRITQLIHLMDPQSLKMVEIDVNTYWRHPFLSVSTPKQLKEFTIMDIELDANRRHVFGRESNKHELADAWVVRSSEIGGKQIHTKTHLGHLLNIGDLAMGFDLSSSNCNDDNLDLLKPEDIPDVILIKKIYGDRLKRHKKRKWKLNRLNVQKEGSVSTNEDREYLDFMEDLEEDPKLREHMNIYKDPKKISVEAEESDNECAPQISLQEMLDDFHIKEDPMDAD